MGMGMGHVLLVCFLPSQHFGADMMYTLLGIFFLCLCENYLFIHFHILGYFFMVECTELRIKINDSFLVFLYLSFFLSLSPPSSHTPHTDRR